MDSKWISDKFKHEILAYYLKGIVHSFPKEQAIIYYRKMIDLPLDSSLIHRLKEDNYNKLFLTGDDNTLENIQSKVFKVEEIVKGKSITYIDFWASWCIPCREEMPTSLELSEIYQSKGINFVYVSIDENVNN
jgi:thiol-disulfide isomerase/thioredoxin